MSKLVKILIRLKMKIYHSKAFAIIKKELTQYHLHNRPNREITNKSDIDRKLREVKFAVI